MSIVLKSRSLLPGIVGDFFNRDFIFNCDLMDFDSDLLMDRMKMVPSVNITENEKDFKIELAVPGLKKDDFKIHFENDLLTVSAEEVKDDTTSRFTRREYYYGSFERSFTLPEGVNGEKIDAHYENGILSLILPKKEEFIKKSIAKEVAVK